MRPPDQAWFHELMRRNPLPPASFYALTRESILFNGYGEKRDTWEVVVGLPHRYMSGAHLKLMEQLVATHANEFRDLDWRELWTFVSKLNKRSRIPPYGEPPYWHEWRGAQFPISILAFWPAWSRLRLAQEPETDREHLDRLLADPDPEVRRAAARV